MASIGVLKLKEAIISASNNLFNNKERIDALNVFPVPDGDTGSNMSSTLQKATDLIVPIKFKDVSELMETLSKNILLSARGNSGVILSQIFKGFFLAWKDKKELTLEDFVSGLDSAAKIAYDSVLKPVEGTILTVIRETSEEANKLKLTNKTTLVSFFSSIVKNARKSLDNTPNLLPVLKEVGVVDSGGEGLAVIFEGIKSYFDGKPVEIDLESTKPFNVVENLELYDGEFGYCTELIIKIENVKEFKKSLFVSKAEKLGNSMVVVNDDDVLKIHIHTVKPGKVLDLGQKYGEFIKVKIENMTEQANSTKSNIEGIKKFEDNRNKIQKKNAIISCNSGSGFINLMKELECDYIIEGGQTNNPSTQDIIEAIENVNARNIFILPNNKNIILAAQQAAKIKSEFNIHIIPTKTQVEGITAIMNYSSELDIDDNTQEIEEGLKNLVVGSITKSIKNTTINGIKIKEDSYLQLLNEKIIGTKKNKLSSAKALIDEMVKNKKRSDLLVIYYGADSSIEDAQSLEKYVLNKYGDIEVQIQEGNQSVYDFIFGLE